MNETEKNRLLISLCVFGLVVIFFQFFFNSWTAFSYGRAVLGHARRTRRRRWHLRRDAVPGEVNRRAATTVSRRLRIDSLVEQVIDRHGPTRHGGLRLRLIAATVDCWYRWLARAIDHYHVVAVQVNVPDYLRSSREVVGSLFRHATFCNRPTIFLTANLDGEIRRLRKELPPGPWAGGVGGVRTE